METASPTVGVWPFRQKACRIPVSSSAAFYAKMVIWLDKRPGWYSIVAVEPGVIWVRKVRPYEVWWRKLIGRFRRY